MEEIEEISPLRVASTVQALSSALRGNRENAPAANRSKGDRVFPDPEKLWFKESSAKNLRNRDFLSPATVLNTLYADGQVGTWTSFTTHLLRINDVNAHTHTDSP